MLKISFFCVNFNGPEYTLKFCDSLLNQYGRGVDFDLQCFIVDNSTDENSAAIVSNFAELHSWVNYIRSPSNIGYFGGFNYAFDNLNYDDSNYVVICNNDLIVDEKFCQILFMRTYESNVFAVCPDVLTKDGFHQNPHVMKRIGWLRRFKLDVYFCNYFVAKIMLFVLAVLRPRKTSPTLPVDGCELHMGIGACYVLTSEFLKRFKKLNYPHFLYGEEAYFSDQIHSAGGILWLDPELLVHHAESASLSKVPKRVAYEYARSGYSSYRGML